MVGFTVLDQADEDKLHATRLLNIEERPFKRLSKKLLGPDTPYQQYLKRPAPGAEAPAEEAAAANGDTEADHAQFLQSLQKFREAITFEFATFESSIARLQLLRSANERERERYGAEKLEIEATAEEVRDSTTNLRIQLDEAQKTLAVRKTYDTLADQVTRNVNLKPRDEQHANIEKLRAEIEDLEKESQELGQTWVDRREQFSIVVGEAARLRRQIRNEKEPEEAEAERRDREMLGVERDQDPASNVGTPRPEEDASTPAPISHESRALTPVPENASTPLPDGSAGDVDMTEQSQVQINVTGEKPADEMDTT